MTHHKEATKRTINWAVNDDIATLSRPGDVEPVAELFGPNAEQDAKDLAERYNNYHRLRAIEKVAGEVADQLAQYPLTNTAEAALAKYRALLNTEEQK